jgi:hypothetical protein
VLLGVAVGRRRHRFQHRAAKRQQHSRGVLGDGSNAGRVLVTAWRRPILTCARHLGIRYWVPRRATRKHRCERRRYHDYSHVFRL